MKTIKTVIYKKDIFTLISEWGIFIIGILFIFYCVKIIPDIKILVDNDILFPIVLIFWFMIILKLIVWLHFPSRINIREEYK